MSIKILKFFNIHLRISGLPNFLETFMEKRRTQFLKFSRNCNFVQLLEVFLSNLSFNSLIYISKKIAILKSFRELRFFGLLKLFIFLNLRVELLDFFNSFEFFFLIYFLLILTALKS